MTNQVPPHHGHQKLLLSVLEVASLLGISRTKVYGLIAAGELEAVHIGRLCKITMAELESYVERLPSGAESLGRYTRLAGLR